LNPRKKLEFREIRVNKLEEKLNKYFLNPKSRPVRLNPLPRLNATSETGKTSGKKKLKTQYRSRLRLKRINLKTKKKIMMFNKGWE